MYRACFWNQWFQKLSLEMKPQTLLDIKTLISQANNKCLERTVIGDLEAIGHMQRAKQLRRPRLALRPTNGRLHANGSLPRHNKKQGGMGNLRSNQAMKKDNALSGPASAAMYAFRS